MICYLKANLLKQFKGISKVMKSPGVSLMVLLGMGILVMAQDPKELLESNVLQGSNMLQESQNLDESQELEASKELESSEEPQETEEPKESLEIVELNGDQVEYSIQDNKAYARGNVVITKGDTVLTCDEVELQKDKQIAIARGHVVLKSPTGKMEGEELVYNFGNGTGDFMGAKISSDPFYGEGQPLSKVGENHIKMKRGYITTCDLDKPHFKLFAPKIDIFPGDKAVARHMRLIVGKVPLAYIPKYVQDISDRKPRFTFRPGYKKDWGAFLLTEWRYYLTDNVRGVLHLDYRERRDIAWGIDLNYDTKKYGEGLIRTYYTHERAIPTKRIWDKHERKLFPTVEKERFKGEWRHQWHIDPKTDAIWQYFRLKDSTFLKDYFDNEFEKDTDPSTFFLLTRALPLGTLSFNVAPRINRFETAVERLPELRYDLPSQELFDSGFFLKSITTYSNLKKKLAAPSSGARETIRLDTNNEVSYPFKFLFIELKPFVGGQQTLYTRTVSSDDNVTRGAFRTGASLSTKFFRVFDAESDKWNIEINKLKHTITPSVSYEYKPDPTHSSSEFDQFDTIDAASRSHGVTFSLENKLQTKRKGKVVDLIRFVVGTDYRLKEDTAASGFSAVTADLELRPHDKLAFNFDTRYDTIDRRFRTVNFDFTVSGDRWWWFFEKRWNFDVDDQVSTELKYTINPKWSFRIYQRFDVVDFKHKEQEYTFVRDLHEWDLEIILNDKFNEGTEVLFAFTLKAFPDIKIDARSTTDDRKPPDP